MAESIYPKLDHESTVNDLLESKLSKSRASEIIMKIDQLKKDLALYRKLRKKWKNAFNVIRGISIAVGVTTGAAVVVTAGVASAGIFIPALVHAIVAGIGLTEGVISGGVGFGLIKKKIHKFSNKCDVISMYVNRLYHFYQKSIDDRKITIEEVEEYGKLIHEYESAISDLSSKDDSGNVDLRMERLKHKAMKEAEVECEIEMLQRLKARAKDELKSKLFQDKN